MVTETYRIRLHQIRIIRIKHEGSKIFHCCFSRFISVVDPKLYFSDPDPHFQGISDPDPISDPA